jgi:hypothetical protein
MRTIYFSARKYFLYNTWMIRLVQVITWQGITNKHYMYFFELEWDPYWRNIADKLMRLREPFSVNARAKVSIYLRFSRRFCEHLTEIVIQTWRQKEFT